MAESTRSTSTLSNYTSSSSGFYKSDHEDDVADDAQPTSCLFCPESFPSPTETFVHLKEKHQFDLKQIRKDLKLDFYGTIKLINYIRREVAAGRDGKSYISSEFLNEGDELLKPVVEGDPLLFAFDDEDEDEVPEPETSDPAQLKQQVKSLEEQLREMEKKYESFREVVAKGFKDELAERIKSDKDGNPLTKEEKRDDDTHYFKSYDTNDIHMTMLKDAVRTDSYRDFVYDNKHLFEGKIVLDVGCGSGILSMFCAKAGAKQVYSIDNSEIINKARQNVIENGLQDKITLIKGKIEEIELPVKQVDIIISEWMGYCLLYEAMLDSVIFARDKYLAPTGLMVPSVTSMAITPINSEEYVNSYINYWSDVYGFKMNSMKTHIYEDVDIISMPLASSLSHTESSPSNVPDAFYTIDLHTCKVSDLVFQQPFTLPIRKAADRIDAFVISFETFFTTSRTHVVTDRDSAQHWPSKQPGEVAFTTGMLSVDDYAKTEGKRGTHWQQGVLRIKPIDMEMEDKGVVLSKNEDKDESVKEGDLVEGRVIVERPKDNSREIDIAVEWWVARSNKTLGPTRGQRWRMS
ncbi:S-adenosyl-L-methionine-dependent methyltransferase [Ascobolus immersus RN42]|uniref:type I protein arginine methyltransferase n=1 Tax=Ascobolus immersus RN42 TaxID=1160509 RepID=A0A3N4IFD3_ASCIM|nr:S-adenosyl-L-methionine-dependent methyltransferase [Ascobolus immersus RN42]